MNLNEITTKLRDSWDNNNPDTTEEYQKCKLESQKLIQEYINLPQNDIRVDWGWGWLKIYVYDDVDLDTKMEELKRELNPNPVDDDIYVNWDKHSILPSGTAHSFRVGRWSTLKKQMADDRQYKSYRL